MNYLKLQGKLKEIWSNQFIRNIGWLSGSQLVIRIIKLGSTVVLARFLTEYDYGLAAIVLATTEFARVFANVGISAKLIQAEPEDLDELCNSAYWLNWVIFVALFFGQCLAAFPIAWFYNDKNLILPICLIGLVYLITPISSINAYLIQRENRLKIIGYRDAISLSIGSLVSLILALFKVGIWAFVFPHVLAAPIWVYVNLKHHPWRPKVKFTTKRWGEIFNFGKSILGVQLLNTLTNNLDYLIVGRFLGIQELGIYYFAFNAGYGISLSIIQAIKSALLPHLCAIRSNWTELKQQYFKSLKIIALIITPLVLLQSSLAPFYVPIIYGEKWIAGIPVLMLICLSAIPRPFADAASQLLITVGRPDLVFRWIGLITGIFVASLLVGVHWQAIGVAIAVLVVQVVASPIFTVWATRYAFKQKPS